MFDTISTAAVLTGVIYWSLNVMQITINQTVRLYFHAVAIARRNIDKLCQDRVPFPVNKYRVSIHTKRRNKKTLFKTINSQIDKNPKIQFTMV